MIVLGQYGAELVDTYMRVLGQFGAIVVGTWWYWVSITWCWRYWMVLGSEQDGTG